MRLPCRFRDISRCAGLVRPCVDLEAWPSLCPPRIPFLLRNLGIEEHTSVVRIFSVGSLVVTCYPLVA